MPKVDFNKMSDDEIVDILDNIDDIDDIDDEEQDDSNFVDDDDSFVDDNDSEDEDEDDNDSEDEDEEDEEDEDEEDEEDEDEESSDDDIDDESNDNNGDNEEDNDDNNALDESDESGDNTPSAGSDTTKTDTIPADEYKRLKEFYDRVTGEFVANGKKVKGFTDPDKIIQAQQMAAGFAQKMAAIKEYKPYLSALKETGVTDNPEKFELMLNVMNGDVEATKKFLKDANIDPHELDMDEVSYQPKQRLKTKVEVALDDFLEVSEVNGVSDRAKKVIFSEWDNDSVSELLSDPMARADLVEHLKTGVYDMVSERIEQKKMTDIHGVYSSKKAIDQYKEAAIELRNELIEQQKKSENSKKSVSFTEEEIAAEMERIKAEQAYVDTNKRNKSKRKKAASLSGNKKVARRKKKKQIDFDPLKLSDEEFEKYVESMING